MMNATSKSGPFRLLCAFLLATILLGCFTAYFNSKRNLSHLNFQKTDVLTQTLELLGAADDSFGANESNLVIDPTCTYSRLEPVKYVASDFEKKWISLVPSIQYNKQQFCQQVANSAESFSQMLQDIAMAGKGGNGSKLLSYFVHPYECGGKQVNQIAYIEPLCAALRDPRSLCLDKEQLMSKEYLLLQRGVHVNQNRSFLFDLGASHWNHGQNWLVERYNRSGIQFDRIFSWEVKTLSPKLVFEPIPKSIHHAYQYLNIPASPIKGDPSNPLTIIKKVTQPEDFVAVKLDIDNWAVESEFVNQIMEDEQLIQLVDEFFFEHHVNFPHLAGAWRGTADMSKGLNDSYMMLSKMRMKGIRSHGWP